MNNVDSIIVRMYNTGSVGDCLFLQFQKNNQTSFTMLIDCGGYNTKTADITKCADDIKKTLSSKAIDLVVVTHEHLDHVSGFNQSKTVFDGIEFHQVWMAWTENDTDPLAKKLKKDLGKKLAALTKTLDKGLKGIKSGARSGSNITGLKQRLSRYETNWSAAMEALNFESGRGYALSGAESLAAAKLKVPDAMKYVKKKSKIQDKNKMFRKPGDVIKDLKGAEGIKFYVLGPPYDKDLSGIKNKLEEDEMYSLSRHIAFAGSRLFLDAVMSTAYNDGVSISPFHKRYIMDKEEEKDFNKIYNSHDMHWRQIEEDWIDSTGQLAIAVNSYTNNTSLALAIEFESSGKVLLFPADAQSGNWISWHNPEVSSSLKKNGGKDADDLLAKTVLYKVGHHGSHNGTASKSGLDKMNDPGLVAIMPLVQNKIPSQWGGSKNFPAKALYKELIKKTNGAILRTDEGLIKDSNAKELRDKNLSAKLKKQLSEATHQFYQEWVVEG